LDHLQTPSSASGSCGRLCATGNRPAMAGVLSIVHPDPDACCTLPASSAIRFFNKHVFRDRRYGARIGCVACKQLLLRGRAKCGHSCRRVGKENLVPSDVLKMEVCEEVCGRALHGVTDAANADSDAAPAKRARRCPTMTTPEKLDCVSMLQRERIAGRLAVHCGQAAMLRELNSKHAVVFDDGTKSDRKMKIESIHEWEKAFIGGDGFSRHGKPRLPRRTRLFASSWRMFCSTTVESMISWVPSLHGSSLQQS
jgi:hypothetical protein